jgi:hypothetical protein
METEHTSNASQEQILSAEQEHLGIRERLGQCVSRLRPAKRWQTLEFVNEYVEPTEAELESERELLRTLWRRRDQQHDNLSV